MLGLFIAADALDFLEKNKIPYLGDQLTRVKIQGLKILCIQ